MKRKIITQEQLDRLVSLGVVEKNRTGYMFDDCYLLRGGMMKDLIGLTVDVKENDNDESHPFRTKEGLPWHIPSFILACNYKKMLAKADKVEE